MPYIIRPRSRSALVAIASSVSLIVCSPAAASVPCKRDVKPSGQAGRHSPYSRVQGAPYSRLPNASPYSRIAFLADPYSRIAERANPYSRIAERANPYSRTPAADPYSRVPQTSLAPGALTWPVGNWSGFAGGAVFGVSGHNSAPSGVCGGAARR